jgi:5-methylcytosine-specific restriction endonuclease McrA
MGTVRPYDPRWVALRKFVLRRDRFLCQIRGPRCTRHATQVDHIVPVCFGGSNNPNNLRAACAVCNQGRRPARVLEWQPKGSWLEPEE